MIIQKLRLEKGWSQQQLADISGLSCRTIQRIEKGTTTPSIESIKSLASVFEVDFLTLKGTLTMKDATTNHININQNETLTVSAEEKAAYRQVRKIKDFYYDLTSYVVINAMLAIINYFVSPDYWWVLWVILGWGIGIIFHAVDVFSPHLFFSAKWEEKQINKYLNKK